METIVFPQGVTTVGGAAFYYCVTIIKYDFTKVLAIPVLSSTTAFSEMNNICKIVVPDSLYDSWIVATNWATYANYIYKTSWLDQDYNMIVTKLFTPSISLSGENLTITDTQNGLLAQYYDLYDGNTLLVSQVATNKTIDLTLVITTAGTYTLHVVARGTGFTDSNASNAVEFSAYSITNVLTNVSAAAGNATVLLSTQSSVALTYTANSGYTLPQGLTSAELDVVGCDFTWNQASGVLTLSNPTGNITVTIVGEVAASGFTVVVSAEDYGVSVYNGIYSTETGDYSGTYLGEATYDNPFEATISIVGTENGVDYGYISVDCGDDGGPNRIQYFPTISANLTLMADLSGTDPSSQYYTSYVYKVTGDGTMSVDAYCLIEGTQITLADGSTKAIEDITYDDELLVWDFYEGKLSIAKPKWIMQERKANKYNLVKFGNGASIGFVGNSKTGYHRIFNQQAGAFTHTGVDKTPIGTLTYDQHGYFPEVVSQEIIKGEVKYYNIITDKHFNLFANGILTSCRLSNKYKIEDMKYVGEELISAEDEENYFKKIERSKKQ